MKLVTKRQTSHRLVTNKKWQEKNKYSKYN